MSTSWQQLMARAKVDPKCQQRQVKADLFILFILDFGDICHDYCLGPQLACPGIAQPSANIINGFSASRTEAQAYGYDEGEPLGSAIAVVGPPGTRSCAVTVEAGRHEKTSLWTKSIVTIFRHITNPLPDVPKGAQTSGINFGAKIGHLSKRKSKVFLDAYRVLLSRAFPVWVRLEYEYGNLSTWNRSTLALVNPDTVYHHAGSRAGEARPPRSSHGSSHAGEEVAVPVWTKRQVTSNSHDGRMLGCECSQPCVNIERRNVPRSGKSTRIRCRSPGALLRFYSSSQELPDSF